MKATSIVDGIQRQSNEAVNVVHLNLLGKAGREVAAAYGVRVVPATVVLDRGGSIVYRHNGFPERARIQRTITAR